MNTYLSIAKEAMAKSDEILEAQRRPKPNGEPGYIITYDPEHRSFRHSLIAIVFAGMYLDALLYITGMKRLGKAEYKKIDRRRYRIKLEVLGISDSEVLSACEHFTTARNELMHERAWSESEMWAAQDEAHKAFNLVDKVANLLKETI